MTVTDTISQADELRLNTISDEQKAAWVMGLDQQIGERIDMASYVHSWPAGDGELLLPAPYDRVYVLYLCSQIDYYNNERYQWSLAKLSPAEYYRYVTTGEYPIPVTGDIQASVPGGAAPEPPEFNAFVSGEGIEKGEASASPSPQT